MVEYRSTMKQYYEAVGSLRSICLYMYICMYVCIYNRCISVSIFFFFRVYMWMCFWQAIAAFTKGNHSQANKLLEQVNLQCSIFFRSVFRLTCICTTSPNKLLTFKITDMCITSKYYANGRDISFEQRLVKQMKNPLR